MFTGLVEEIGTVVSLTFPPGDPVDPGGADVADAVLTVRAPLVTTDAPHGASIAVDGVCLTVTDRTADDPARAEGGDPSTFTVDVMPETLRRTSLGALTPGDRVNLERALPAGGRLGGHLVQGHVDGVGRLRTRTPGPRWDELTFDAEPAVVRYLAEKGSVTVSGVSLTVTWVTGTAFGVSLIPTTLTETTLGALRPGDPVNLEVDVLSKYVERHLQASAAPQETTR